jgi:TetR/AcrR family transcriptional regulator, transcriptional repressor for nem operon
VARTASFDRDVVLDALMTTFWTHGFEATSLDALERATGLKRQSLYNAFGDKEAMFLASLAAYGEQVGRPLQALLANDDPRQALQAYLEGHLKILSDADKPAGCLFATCSSELGARDDRLGSQMRVETQASLDALNVIFRRWADQGNLSAEMKPETFAALLTAMVRGIALLARSINDPDILENAVDGALQVLQPSIHVK